MKRYEVRGLLLVFVLVPLLLLLGCKDFSFFTALGDMIDDSPVVISPATVSVPANGTITFSASGGIPPYRFAVASGTGSIDSATGIYMAPPTAGTEIVRATDSKGRNSDATITVTPSGGPLAITPSTVTLVVNGSLTFIATGGIPPYSFSITSAGSGTPSVNAATGFYTAGSFTGVDVVRVQDGSAATSNATVTVSGAVTNVDYTITATNFPATGNGGAAIPGGYDFTIRNIGSGGGSQAVSWWVFISTDAALGSGDAMLASGSTGALGSGATANIPLAGTWPAAAGNRWLFVMLSAADDLTPANNTSAGYMVTLSAPDIDYTVTIVNNSGATVVEGPLNGNFDLLNTGTFDGSQTVYWTAYVSTDTVLDAGDSVADTGSRAPLNAGASQSGIAFSGTWPAIAGTYYLIVKVSAGDDINAGNDAVPSASVAVTIPNVDYIVTVVSYTGGTRNPGATVNGTFQFNNSGANNGSQAVSWAAYASLNTILDGLDTQVVFGSTTPLAAGATSLVIPFSGTWPLDYSNYYLLVRVHAPEDINPGNNTGSTGGTTAVGFFDESLNEPNNDINLTDAYNLGITVKPGMSVQVSGSMAVADDYDVMSFNTGTANSVTVSMGWSGNKDVTIFIFDAPATPDYGVSISNATSLSLAWTVDAASTLRWIVVRKDSAGLLGAYILIITAN